MGNFSPGGRGQFSGHKKRARTPNGKGARCPKCAHAQPHFVSCVHGPQHAAGACARMPLGGPEAGCWPRRRCAAGALLLAGGGATRMVCNLSRCAPIPMEPSSLTYTFYAQLILTGGSSSPNIDYRAEFKMPWEPNRAVKPMATTMSGRKAAGSSGATASAPSFC